jgi:diadenylate cyclase
MSAGDYGGRDARSVRVMAENGRQEWFGTAYGPVAKSARCLGVRKRALEAIVQLAVELAREGREGRKIGTLFVIGDVENVLARSRPLLLDPLHGHAPELLHADLPDFRETVKELAQLDGAFLVDDDGRFVSAGRYIDVDVSAPANFLPGLGTRHAAAASVSRETKATAVAVSQSSVVRVFSGGEIRAEIIPELFLMSRDGLFTRAPEVSQVPELGVTLAVAGESSS